MQLSPGRAMTPSTLILCSVVLAACSGDDPLAVPASRAAGVAAEPIATSEATPEIDPGPVLQIVAGRFHTCVLRTDQAVVCWGDDLFSAATPLPGTFVKLSDPTGTYTTCGLRDDLTVACWGRNAYGERDPPSGTFESLTGGRDHMCGIRTDGTVACWGRPNYAGTPPAGTFTKISSGLGHHTCGLRPDGTIDCWGWNIWGQTNAPGGVFVDLTAGENHTCAIDRWGTTTCWGRNVYGETSPPSLSFVEVAPGQYHTCGLRPGVGYITCWGLNTDGVTEPPLPQGYTRVVAGQSHACAVRVDGSVVCWGNDGYHQLDVPVELSNRPPKASVRPTTPVPWYEGAPLSLDASGSADPEGEPLTYDWDFGDGSTGSGVLVEHLYADEGGYAVVLTATDPLGRFDVEKRPVKVRNVPPSVGPLPDTLLVEGEMYVADGTFTDPGADHWTGLVRWNMAMSFVPLPLDEASKTFALSHAYEAEGVYTVEVKISDHDGGEGLASATVTVLAPAAALGELVALVDALEEEGVLSAGAATALRRPLQRAAELVALGNPGGEVILSNAVVRRLDTLELRGEIDAATHQLLLDWVDRVLARLSA